MKESILSALVGPIREMLDNRDEILAGWKDRHGEPLARYACDFFPWEIVRSLGFLPVREKTACCGAPAPAEEGEGDLRIMPRTGRHSTVGGRGVMEITVPGGWGEDWAAAMHGEVKALAASLEGRYSGPDPGRLADAAAQYNDLRRLVRSVVAARNGSPRLLSHRDLHAVYDAAVMLPPDIATDLVAEVLQGMLSAKEGRGVPGGLVPCLLATAGCDDGSLADEIEEAGCLVIEDDACDGRRQFDMSYAHESPHLYYEILDAFSYRPLCPALRAPEERFELFYKLLRGHGIDLVVFADGGNCPAFTEGAEFLRVRLMRAGIDPLVAPAESAGEAVRKYLERAQRPSMFK